MAAPETGTASAWQPKPQQNAKALRLFHEGMDDIHESLRLLQDGHVGSVGTIGRRVSVELRKLLFDATPLVHRVVHRPRFHALLDKAALTGDVYENETGIQFAPGPFRPPPESWVASHKWRLVVYPLHGLNFDKAGMRWVFGALFDRGVASMALGTWLRQGLFVVEGREYTLLDTLKFVANKEAVHVDVEKDEAVRDMERVHFGHTTYPHLVSVMVASYVLDQFRESYRVQPEAWEAFHGFAGSEVADYEVIGGGEFQGAEIDPMGFGGEMHETGIQIPEPGKEWKPVRISEEATVRA